jgi:hypothetical protein
MALEGVRDDIQEAVDKEGAGDVAQMAASPIELTDEMAQKLDGSAALEYQSGLEKTCLDKLMGDFTKREDWRRPYEILWWQIYLLYMSGQVASKTPSRAKVFIPICYQIIEAATPKLISFLSDNDSQFGVVPQDIKQQQIADNVKNLLQKQLQLAGFNRKYESFIKQLLMYGTSYFFVDWKVRYAWVWERVPETTIAVDPATGANVPTTKYVDKKTYKIVERRPELTFLDILDVFPAQDYPTVDDQPGIYIRRFVNKDEFEARTKGDAPYFANANAVKDSGTSQKYQETRQWRKSARGETATTTSSQIELIEYWGPYDLDGSGRPCECQIVIANRSVIVRAVANPYYHQKRPLIKVCFTNIPGEWFGMGLIEPVVCLQNELNTVRRQRLDNVNLMINRMWKVLSTADVDIDKLVAAPGGIVLTDNMDAIEPLPPQDITQSSYADAEKIVQDMFNATIPPTLTGSIDDMKGMAKGGGGLGVARVAVSQALEKFATAAKNVEEEGVKKLLELFYQLDLQYLNNAEVLKAFYGDIFPTGPNGENLVTPEMIRGQVNFTMTVLSEMVNKDAKVNQMISYYSVFQAVLSPESQEAIAKQVWELEGFDGDQIHVNPPQPAMAPAMGGLPGGAPPAMDGLGPRGGLPTGVPSNKVPMTPQQSAAQGAAILRQAGQTNTNLKGAPNAQINPGGV